MMLSTNFKVSICVCLIIFFTTIRFFRLKALSRIDYEQVTIAFMGVVFPLGLIYECLTSSNLQKILGVDIMVIFLGGGSLALQALENTGLGEDIKFLFKPVLSRIPRQRNLAPSSPLPASSQPSAPLTQTPQSTSPHQPPSPPSQTP